MAITTAIAIYFLIWWIVLFAVLPWGVRAQGEESAPGTDPGARACHISRPSWSGPPCWRPSIFAACASPTSIVW